ncbi:hypothetical protein ACMAZF_14675 [Psychrobium sp. nBUS_13]|uniref:hypothetical protein n=1 Tax=Psychrobium sp. nBUS_13 TaxID=3395319 RepID=UPI003EBD8B2D
MLNEFFSQQQTRYIVEAATNSYFNGVDKTTILDTLASEYSIATAFISLENIASKSVHHNDFKKYNTVLKEQLSKGEYFSQSQTPYLEISPWSEFYGFNGSAVERANLQVINYPDIATSLWIRTADASVHSEDFQGLQYSIGQLAIIIMQAPFTRAQKQSIINDLSAINSATFYYPSSLQLHQVASQGNHLLRLNHFKMDVSAINFIELSQLSFNTNEQLLAKWQLLIDKFHIQNPEPKGDTWCDKNEQKKPIHKITKVSLKPYIEQENYSLFSEFLSQCMLIDNMMEIGFFISQQGWKPREIFSVESMQDVSFTEKANQLKQQFPDQLSGIFSFESTNSLTDFKNRTQQLSLLIDHGLYPRNANIAMAMRKLSIEESMTLIKKAGDIEPINKYKATLVYNAVLSNNPSLAIALINQGYPLTTEENAPDPLQASLIPIDNESSKTRSHAIRVC